MNDLSEAPVRILLTYNIPNTNTDDYYHFMLGNFVPTLQRQSDIAAIEAWHTAIGNYPLRLVSFVMSDNTDAQTFFATEVWQALEGKLQTLVNDYNRRVVTFKPHFQW